MMPVKLPVDKHKNLIIAVSLIIILVLDFVFLLGPQIRLLSKLGSKLSVLSRDLKNAKKDISARQEFENKLAILKEKLKEWGSSVKSEEELSLILEGISRTANQTFVKVTQIKPLKEEKQAVFKTDIGTYYQIPILVDAQSVYHAVGKFLNELEEGGVFMKVLGLEITVNPQEAFRHLVRLTIQTVVLGK